MPAIPVRRKLLDELDDFYQSTKRARLDIQLQEVTQDLQSSPSRCSSASFISDLSTDLDIDSDGLDDDSDVESVSPSDVEAECLWLFEVEMRKLRHEITTTRVLNAKAPIAKSSQIHLLDKWRAENLSQFWKKVRVDPDTFDGLLQKIVDHPVFYNNSNVPQAPVTVQLAIFLNRAGHYGNSASPEDIGQWAGVSPGSVNNATNRVIIALLSLHDKAVHLPNTEEKETAKDWVGAQACPEWRDGYLLVDGTKLAVFQRPGLHGDAWFDKNKDYSLDCQVCTSP
jgi:hypothetical protein